MVQFSASSRAFASGLVEPRAEQITAAKRFVNGLHADGGTNLCRGMVEALRAQPSEGTVPVVVLLTDGQATVGTTDESEILDKCREANKHGARIFTFGIGYDVNVGLLDALTTETGGARDYVQSDESISLRLKAFLSNIDATVLTDVALVAEAVEWHGLVPDTMPDLYSKSRIILVGRYSTFGGTAIRLTGKLGMQPRQFYYGGTFPSSATEDPFVATILAQRRIGQLMDRIRREGEDSELVAEIRRIALEHGLVTPYTSRLIVENWKLATEARRRARASNRRQPEQRERVARIRHDLVRAGIRVHAGAFAKAFGEELEPDGRQRRRMSPGLPALRTGGSLASARLMYRTTLDDRPRTSLLRTHRIGGRLFHFVDGVWVDSRYEQKMAVRRVTAFSKEYFQLLERSPELGRVLSFSTAMVVVLGSLEAVEIAPPAKVESGAATRGDGR